MAVLTVVKWGNSPNLPSAQQKHLVRVLVLPQCHHGSHLFSDVGLVEGDVGLVQGRRLFSDVSLVEVWVGGVVVLVEGLFSDASLAEVWVGGVVVVAEGLFSDVVASAVPGNQPPQATPPGRPRASLGMKATPLQKHRAATRALKDAPPRSSFCATWLGSQWI